MLSVMAFATRANWFGRYWAVKALTTRCESTSMTSAETSKVSNQVSTCLYIVPRSTCVAFVTDLACSSVRTLFLSVSVMGISRKFFCEEDKTSEMSWSIPNASHVDSGSAANRRTASLTGGGANQASTLCCTGGNRKGNGSSRAAQAQRQRWRSRRLSGKEVDCSVSSVALPIRSRSAFNSAELWYRS